MPTLTLNLGLNATDEFTIGALLSAARDRVKVAHSGRAELAFLYEDEALHKAKLQIMDSGELAVEVEVPAAAQGDAFGHRVDRRRRRGDPGLLREDAAEQQAADRAERALRANAALGPEVARIMSGEADPVPLLRALERKEGVDTHAWRHFHLYQQEDMVVQLTGGASVTFAPAAVRRGVAAEQAVQVSFFGHAPERGWMDIPGRVVQVVAQTANESPSRRVYDFRFFGVEKWQQALLAAAVQLDLPFEVQARPVTSTCSLKAAPWEVESPIDWGLLRTVVVGLISQGGQAAIAAESDLAV